MALLEWFPGMKMTTRECVEMVLRVICLFFWMLTILNAILPLKSSTSVGDFINFLISSALMQWISFIALGVAFGGLLGKFGIFGTSTKLAITRWCNELPLNWKPLTTKKELWRAVIKNGNFSTFSTFALDPIEWSSYATYNKINGINGVNDFDPAAAKSITGTLLASEKKKRSRHSRRNGQHSQLHKQVKLDRKYTLLETGLPGRFASAHLVTANSLPYARFTSLVELPNFLTETECDDLIAELSDEGKLGKLKPQDDAYRDGAHAPQNATYTMLHVHDHASNKDNADRQQLFTLKKLKKMIEPFSNGFHSCKFKKYSATSSSQVGVKIHTDGGLFTLLIYLETVPYGSGGSTDFPNLGLRFQPIKGNAIWFRNDKQTALDKNWHIDLLLRHSGEPLKLGTKHILQFQSDNLQKS